MVEYLLVNKTKLTCICVIHCRTRLRSSQDDAVFSLHGGAGQNLNGQDKGNKFWCILPPPQKKSLCVWCANLFFWVILIRELTWQHFFFSTMWLRPFLLSWFWFNKRESCCVRGVAGERSWGRESGREGCLSFLLTGAEPRCAFWSGWVTTSSPVWPYYSLKRL